MQSTILKKKNLTRSKFTIQVFPHLKKFIAKTYGAGVIRTDESTVFGRLVTAALRDNRIRKDFNHLDWHMKTTAQISIQLTTEQSGLGPKLGKLGRLNLDMDRVFKESLSGWILAQKQAGVMAYTACKAFLEFYGIDDSEYSLDAAYKHWQRSKKSDGTTPIFRR